MIQVDMITNTIIKQGWCINISQNTIQSLRHSYDLGNSYHQRVILAPVSTIEIFDQFQENYSTAVIGVGADPIVFPELVIKNSLRMRPDGIIIPHLNQLIVDAHDTDELIHILVAAGDGGTNITIAIDDLDYISITFIITLIGKSFHQLPVVQNSLLIFGEF